MKKTIYRITLNCITYKTGKTFLPEIVPLLQEGAALIEEAKAAHPELAAVGIEMILARVAEAEVADAFDYYYVPERSTSTG